jgi:23S rRNA pseudouridine1911/1915/1917 synthase
VSEDSTVPAKPGASRAEDYSLEDVRSWICYEDNSIIVFDKPMGLPTQPTPDRARQNLFGLAQDLELERKGSAGYVGLHHRLDRLTSGLVLMTRDKDVNGAVADLFKERQIKKIYWAVAQMDRQFRGNFSELGVSPVEGLSRLEPGVQWTVINHLRESRKFRGTMEFTRAGGDLAETHFQVVELKAGQVSLIATPHTGRMHQIRVHAVHSGLKLVGDPIYPKKLESAQGQGRMMLHAGVLRFEHPISGKAIEIASKPPKDFPIGLSWDAFLQSLAYLK